MYRVKEPVLTDSFSWLVTVNKITVFKIQFFLIKEECRCKIHFAQTRLQICYLYG